MIDGLPNYFHIVHTAGQKLPLLEAGINPIRVAAAVDGRRRLLALIEKRVLRYAYRNARYGKCRDLVSVRRRLSRGRSVRRVVA